MSAKPESSASAYDKYVDYKRFAIAVSVFIIILILPTPKSMLDVGVEYSQGQGYVLDMFSRELFGSAFKDVQQWEAYTVRGMEAAMRQGTLRKEMLLKRKQKDFDAIGVKGPKAHYDQYRAFIEPFDETKLNDLLLRGNKLRLDELTYAQLTPDQQQKADRATRNIKTCVALIAFVVICFITEAIPLPGVAFCIGLILVFSGMVSRADIAQMFWSDAVWFIMGSLMFATAFVKTGVDKRICLAMFSKLAKPSLGWITAVFIMVISPAAAFISDHALAAIFLPIGLILYSNSLSMQTPEDKELVKMLMITIAMACNIGGFGAPSGGARNVIILTYMEEMFGITMSYGKWMIIGFPYVIIMMPILWLTLNWRFKPQIRNLEPALATLRQDIVGMGKWSPKQILTVVIFLVMLTGWITEQDILTKIFGIRLGIGVIALAGAVAYLLTGIVNWRDYQTKVDWGVVWLYAGAIAFGRILDSTGGGYWLARSIVEGLAYVGMSSGLALLAAGGIVTGFITQLMADGPAAALVGPITLRMAAIADPGTVLVPFMGLITACASSMAYMLIIGTPPNAIVYASGFLAPKDFLRVGAICFVAAFVLMLLMAIFYWPLIGFSGMAPISAVPN